MSAALTAALEASTLADTDPSGRLADACDLSNQLRDALWRVESAGIAPFDAPGGLIVAGMGGAGIGGALAAAALGDRSSRPIGCARAYELPAWATPDTAVLCASYSGETEETLACFEAATALGAPRIVATTGGRLADAARAEGVPVIPLPAGFTPSGAVAYMTVAALEAAALSGAAPRVHSEIDVAAAHAEALVEDWGPAAGEDSLGKRLAAGLHETIPVIMGAGPTTVVARRWKTQINEHAKTPAFWGELPEVDHNELAGWAAAPGLGRFSAVFLDDTDLHPRVRRRIEATRALIEASADTTFVVPPRGESRTERVFSMVLLGDLVSLYLAALRGVDPADAGALHGLEARLAQSD